MNSPTVIEIDHYDPKNKRGNASESICDIYKQAHKKSLCKDFKTGIARIILPTKCSINQPTEILEESKGGTNSTLALDLLDNTVTERMAVSFCMTI
jgi:hypothetical protein